MQRLRLWLLPVVVQVQAVLMVALVVEVPLQLMRLQVTQGRRVRQMLPQRRVVGEVQLPVVAVVVAVLVVAVVRQRADEVEAPVILKAERQSVAKVPIPRSSQASQRST
jgi:hypothetical protein